MNKDVLANNPHRFPTAALLVLVVGFVAVTVVILLPFSSLYGTANVNSFDKAKQLADQYLGARSDLRIKEIMEFSNNFYIIVQEKSTGINAFELLVDRYTGRVMPEHGPNMMWNTNYGMMGRSQ